MVERALRAGDPRRSRALARVLARGALPGQRAQLAILEARALLWEGAFERAIAVLDARVTPTPGHAPEIAAIVIRLECLLFAERPGEAKALFDHHRDALRATYRWKADVASISAFLRFHAGDLEGARSELEAALRRTSVRVPITRAMHLCLAEIAHREGSLEETRRHLDRTIRPAADLFIVDWAAAQRRQLFPDDPTPARARPRRASSASSHSGLWRNLRVGLAVLFFRTTALRARAFTVEQVAALVVLDVALVELLRLVDYSSGAYFFGVNVLTLAAPIPFFLLTALVAAPRSYRRHVMLRVLGGFYAALPLVLIVVFVAIRMQPRFSSGPTIVEWAAGAWLLAVVVRLARSVAPDAGLPRMLAIAPVFGATWLLPMFLVARTTLFFAPSMDYADYEASQQRRDALVFAQADLVRDAEGSLAPERPGVTDLYFVGAAGWADQDVFGNEVRFAKSTLDARFDTRGRSIILANDAETNGVLPVTASPTLRHALRAVGLRMNREEDVLFLFVTSHGSAEGLAIHPPREGGFHSETLSPSSLRSMLEYAGIKWRVLVIAGCESGVFIEPLANEFTLIATAAANDRNSYGCATGNAYTDFGRAIFAEQLYAERSFPLAFTSAVREIDKRESAADLRASRPQVSQGSAIGAKLRELEERLAVRSPK